MFPINTSCFYTNSGAEAQAKTSALLECFTQSQIKQGYLPIEEFAKEVKRRLEIDMPLEKDKIKALTLKEFMALPADNSAEWLLPGLIRPKDRMLLHAKKGVGKTWCVYILALCMANGSSLELPSRRSNIPAKIVILDGEQSVEEVQHRMQPLAKAFNIPFGNIEENIKIISASELEMRLDLQDKATREEIQPDLDWADVIILDNINALWPEALQAGPESSQELNSYVNSLAFKGKAVLLINHSSRNGNSFGSSSKEFCMETVVELKQTSEKQPSGATRIKATFKVRWGSELAPLTIDLYPETVGLETEVVGLKKVILSGWENKDAIISQPEDTPDSIEEVAQIEAYLDKNNESSEPEAESELKSEPELKVEPELKLESELELVLGLYNEGYQTYRAIEEQTKILADKPDSTVKAISKNKVGRLIKELKRVGKIKDSDSK